jgi:hypothetical protein
MFTMNLTAYAENLDEPEAKVIHMGSDLAISPKPNKKEVSRKVFFTSRFKVT